MLTFISPSDGSERERERVLKVMFEISDRSCVNCYLQASSRAFPRVIQRRNFVTTKVSPLYQLLIPSIHRFNRASATNGEISVECLRENDRRHDVLVLLPP